MRRLKAADLFCGAGGASNGLVRACRTMDLKIDLVAVNHWPRAIETHAANQEETMGANSKIEWTDATWNPIRFRNAATGGVGHYCEKVSPGCAHCYAERMQPRFKNPIRYNAADLKLGEVFLDEDELEKPLRWKKPRMVFPCSMTDLFGRWVKPAWLAAIFAVMDRTPQHTYQVVTKRPEDIPSMWPGTGQGRESGGPAGWIPNNYRGNCWLLTSVEDQATALARIPHLLACRDLVPVLGLSVEPLIGPVNLSPWLDQLDWCIVGTEAGPRRRPSHIDWIRSIRDQCKAAGVPLFVKQAEIDRKLVKMPAIDGKVWDEFPVR